MAKIKGPQAPAPSPRSLREIFTFIMWFPNLLELKKGGLHSRYKKGRGGGEEKHISEMEKGSASCFKSQCYCIMPTNNLSIQMVFLFPLYPFPLIFFLCPDPPPLSTSATQPVSVLR